MGESPSRAARRVGYLPQRKAFAPNFPAHGRGAHRGRAPGTWPLRVQRPRARGGALRPGAGRRRGPPRSAPRRRSPAARPSASSWPAPWSTSRRCSCSTSPRPGSTPAAGPSSSTSWPRSHASGALAAVLVTHNLDAVRRLAHRVVYLDGTVVACGTPGRGPAATRPSLPRAFPDTTTPRPARRCARRTEHGLPARAARPRTSCAARCSRGSPWRRRAGSSACSWSSAAWPS